MKIPKTVKIMGFDWSIKKDKSVATEGNIYGSTHHGSQTIFLDPENTPQKMEETLLHEMLHAIAWQTGVEKRHRKLEGVEEDFITALASGLYSVIRDNKLF